MRKNISGLIEGVAYFFQSFFKQNVFFKNILMHKAQDSGFKILEAQPDM